MGVRYKTLNRFYIDDYFVVLSWLSVLIYATIYQIRSKDLQLYVTGSLGFTPYSRDFIETRERILKLFLAGGILCYSALWSVKLSFVFFFWRLYRHAGQWVIVWWVVFGITAASYAVCIGTIPYDCLVTPLRRLPDRCVKNNYKESLLILICALDISTDLLRKSTSNWHPLANMG